MIIALGGNTEQVLSSEPIQELWIGQDEKHVRFSSQEMRR